MPVTEWLPYQWYETANIHPSPCRTCSTGPESRRAGRCGLRYENGAVRTLGVDDNLHAKSLIVVER